VAQIDPIWSDRMLSVLRIIAALLFLQHGLAKYFGFPHVAAFDNLKVLSLVGLAGAIEIVGSVLLLLGRQPSSCRARWRLPISCRMRREASFPY